MFSFSQVRPPFDEVDPARPDERIPLAVAVREATNQSSADWNMCDQPLKHYRKQSARAFVGFLFCRHVAPFSK